TASAGQSNWQEASQVARDCHVYQFANHLQIRSFERKGRSMKPMHSLITSIVAASLVLGGCNKKQTSESTKPAADNSTQTSQAPPDTTNQTPQPPPQQAAQAPAAQEQPPTKQAQPPTRKAERPPTPSHEVAKAAPAPAPKPNPQPVGI